MSAYSEASKAVFGVFDDTTPARRGPVDRRGVPRRRRAAPDVGHAHRDRRAAAAARCSSRSGCPSPSASPAPSSWPRWRAAWPSPTACCVVPPDGELDVPAPAAGRAAVGRRAGDRREARRPRDHAPSARSPGWTRPRSSPCWAGRSGRHLHALAHNRDPRPVAGRPAPGLDRLPARPRAAARARPPSSTPSSWRLVDRVTRRMRAGRPGRAHGGAPPPLRRLHPRHPVAHAAPGRPPRPGTDPARRRGRCSPAAAPLIDASGLTLVGVAVGNLDDDGAVQLALPFDATAAPLDAALDDVRDRFGTDAGRPAAVLLGPVPRRTPCPSCPTERSSPTEEPPPARPGRRAPDEHRPPRFPPGAGRVPEARMTRFGFHASHEQIPPGPLLDAARRAAEVGFTAAMCSDHFAPWTSAQGQSGFAWSWLGAALATTDLPFGVVTAPGQRYHPAVHAQGIATLASMFPGRFWAALGSGQALNEHVTGARGPPRPSARPASGSASTCCGHCWPARRCRTPAWSPSTGPGCGPCRRCRRPSSARRSRRRRPGGSAAGPTG